MADYTIVTPNLGTAPLGTGGDDQRDAFTQLSANWTSLDTVVTWDDSTLEVRFSNDTVNLIGGRQSIAYTPIGVSVVGLQVKSGLSSGSGSFGHTGVTLFGDDDNFAGVHVVHDNAADAQLVLVSNNLEAARFDSSQNGALVGTLSVAGTTAILTSGTGTPEGAVVAPIGSLFTRTDGGASTTLYVKESGAGNTGWVAK